MMREQNITTKIVDRRHVGEGILEFVLAPVTGTDLPSWEPGAHIDLILPEKDKDGEPLIRQYSLCGNPAELSNYHLGILRDESGRGGSEYIHARLQIGDEIAISAPRNHFPFKPGQRTLFIAGGIGITPILPMVRHAITQGHDWQLIVAARNRTRLPFLDALSSLPQDRIQYHCDDEAGILDLAGLLSNLNNDTTVYSCGPAPLLNALQSLNEGAAWHLHIERFAASPLSGTSDNTPFDVICRKSKKQLHVPADKSLLQVLREAGIKVESSCRDGICGTCEINVFSGTPCHRDSVLTKEEREDGTHMMVCVSRSKSDILELDI